jgi:hypothetical protein
MLAQLVQTLVVIAVSQAPAEDSLNGERLEAMLAQGDTAMVRAVFRRQEDQVLDFIDGYLEGGLKAIEDGQGSADAAAQAMAKFRTAIKFAELADQAFPGAELENYAASFASWSPKEQKMFREGQAAYKAGRQAKDDPAKASGEYRRAVGIAERLGDSYGAALAYGALAAAELQRGNHEAVAEAARTASDINTKLKRRLATIRVLLVWGDSMGTQGARGGGLNMYNHAWTLLKADDPVDLRAAVFSKMSDAMTKLGDTAGLERIKRQYESRFGPLPAPSPATP